jgi:hypothetical protein
MARLTRSEVRAITDGLEDRYPPVLTYEQAARLVQVQLPTLKGWLSQGRFARCVKRGKPGRIVRDLFLMEFLGGDRVRRGPRPEPKCARTKAPVTIARTSNQLDRYSTS